VSTFHSYFDKGEEVILSFEEYIHFRGRRDASAYADPSQQVKCNGCGSVYENREDFLTEDHRAPSNIVIQTSRCTAFQTLMRMWLENKAPVPKIYSRRIAHDGIPFELGDGFATTSRVVDAVPYIDATLAALFRSVKGEMLTWAVQRAREDEEFRDAVHVISRYLGGKPIDVVKFVCAEFERYEEERKRRKFRAYNEKRRRKVG
jgi:DNA-binding cell septation regulator SpoVG